MNEGNPKIAELKSGTIWGKHHYILFADRLVHEWDYKTGNRGKVHYLLHELSPEIYIQQTHERGASSDMRHGLFLLALSLAVGTSDFQRNIPLLAPVLLFFGIGPFISGIMKYRDRSYSIIQRPDGGRVLSFEHRRCNDQARDSFERLFEETVKKATNSQQSPEA